MTSTLALANGLDRVLAVVQRVARGAIIVGPAEGDLACVGEVRNPERVSCLCVEAELS